MISVKVKGKNDESTYLKNIKEIKLSFHNKIPRYSGPHIKGWHTLLGESGDRLIAMRIQGILCNSKAESILNKAALYSEAIFCEIILQKETKEVVSAEFFVELYEKDCVAGQLEHFSVILVSSGSVEHHIII